MLSQEEAQKAKKLNIVDMGVGFTAMMRLLRPGSAEIIKRKLGETLGIIDEISSNNEFEILHDNFYAWVRKNVTLAKEPEPPSYGQAAKILDIVLKVYVYYCRQPDDTKSSFLLPMLNCGIDTPILRHLVDIHGYPRKINRLKHIDKKVYVSLQNMIRSDIKESFANNIFPVQYDDIMWRRLNR